MKLEDYVHYMNQITPTKEMDMRMAETFSAKDMAHFETKGSKTGKRNEAQRKGKRIYSGRTVWKPAIVFVALLFFCIPVTVFADDLKSFFTGLFIKETGPVNQAVNEDVFADEDGHVRVEVKEVVADRHFIAAVIKYEALDDYGKEWLENKEKETPDSLGWDSMSPQERADMFEHEENELFEIGLFRLAVESSDGAINREERDIQEYRTENERYYVAYNRSALGADIGIVGKPKLYYKLTDGNRSVELEIKPAKEYTFTLDGPAIGDGEINPESLEISSLHYRMEAEYGKPEGIPEEMLAVQSVTLHFKDGSTIDCGEPNIVGVAGVGVTGRRLLAAKSFFNWFKMNGITEWYGEEMDISKWFQPVEPENVIGVELDGVYFEAQLQE